MWVLALRVLHLLVRVDLVWRQLPRVCRHRALPASRKRSLLDRRLRRLARDWALWGRYWRLQFVARPGPALLPLPRRQQLPAGFAMVGVPLVSVAPVQVLSPRQLMPRALAVLQVSTLRLGWAPD